MTRPNPVRRVLALLFFITVPLAFASCTTISPEDVKADRARWTAVRDTTADGKVDEQEAPLLGQLLVAWDAKITADEASAGKPRDAGVIFAEVLRVYGAASVQAFLGPELLRSAPEVFRLIDRNGDRILSEQELTSLDLRDPVVAMVVVTTARALLTRHR